MVDTRRLEVAIPEARVAGFSDEIALSRRPTCTWSELTEERIAALGVVLWGPVDVEYYSADDPAEALGVILDDLHAIEDDDVYTLAAMRRVEPGPADLTAEDLLCFAREKLDDEFGDPDTGSEPEHISDRCKDVAHLLAVAVLADYRAWLHTECLRVTVSAAEARAFLVANG